MCLETFFIETLETTQSLFDDNFYFSMSAPGVPEMLAATHVDDEGIAATPEWLTWGHAEFQRAFGKTSRTGLPLTHTGIRRSRTRDGGIKSDQDEY